MAFVSAFLALYGLLVVVLWIGWCRAIRRRPSHKTTSGPFISVIVPMRNEALTISTLLYDLGRQQYHAFEVIIVDDHSDDGSMEVVKAHALKNVSLIKNRGEGKKQAITTGVAVAKGSLIVTTDADCSVPPEWLSMICDHFAADHVKLAFGGVRISNDGNFFSSLQAMEFSSLIGSGAATAALGVPTMCNGANLAYRRTVFEDVHGYEGNITVASGDDEFLMRKVQDRFPGGVQFMGTTGVVVETKAQPTWKTFMMQRMRWAAKWRHNSSGFAVALAFFILICQLSWLIALAVLFFFFHPAVLVVICAKLVLEAGFLLNINGFLRIRWHWPAFFALQLLYPLYVIAVGLLSNVIHISWKQRRIM